MRFLRLSATAILLAAVSACTLTTAPDITEPITVPTPGQGGRPTVTINSPRDNEQFTVGSPVLVNARATDAVGVTRVQLLANDQIVKTISSDSPSGQTSFDVLLDYTPRTQGDVRLDVVAFRGAVASDTVSVQVKIVSASQPTVAVPTLPGGGVQPAVPVIDPNDPTCRLLTNVALRLRIGPGTQFSQITTLSAGRVIPIIGRTGSNDWFQVNASGQIGWVSAQNPQNPNEKYVSLYGNCFNVPVIVLTPTPGSPTLTPVPTLTLTPTAAPTSTPGLPDLIIGSLGGPSTLPPTGQSLPISANYPVTVRNIGTGPAGQFTVILDYFAAAGGGTIQSREVVVAGLAANQSTELFSDSSTTLTFNNPGNFIVRARVDTTNAVAEISEANNEAIKTVEVIAAP